jgi:nitroimidazol reductase NimA-like FMN-containing flavoprotein (pyridoxamine 5'-phosphate oxidase superfamily)
MTREELAGRAGMSTGYVEYLEEHPSDATVATVTRLAAALGTTRAELLGVGTETPSGRGRAAAHSALETLRVPDCRRLIAAGGVGRVVFVAERGPVALPVNFAMIGEDILFRTAAGSPLEDADEWTVGFEVDHIDNAMKEGWSVLVTGVLHRVTDEDELAEARDLRVEPWASGGRDTYLRVQIEEMTGRRIRATA